MQADHLIVCLGLRRAGSTLQYNLARTLLEEIDAGFGAGFLQDGEKVQDHVRHKRNCGRMCVIKTYRYDLDWLARWEGDCSLVTIFRDLRDVYSSHVKKKADITLNEWIVRTRNELIALDSLGNTRRMLYQKYEFVFSNLQGAVQEIAAFLSLRPSPSNIARVAELNTVDAALKTIASGFNKQQRFQAVSNRFLRGLPRGGKQWARAIGVRKLVRWLIPEKDVVSTSYRLHHDHISASRGEPGFWRHELPEQQSAQITEQFEGWLSGHGYLDPKQDVMVTKESRPTP